jgi:hypothetical protein
MDYRMPKHKVLQSVAQSVADSFASLMNYGDDDYVLGHLLNAARVSGRKELHVDLLTGQTEPPQLLVPPVERSVQRYCGDFLGLVDRSGSDRTFVQKAKLRISFDLAVSRPTNWPSLMESPYVCEVVINDDRGKTFVGKNEGWWYPERPGTNLKAT